jgi:hypothetical protein
VRAALLVAWPGASIAGECHLHHWAGQGLPRDELADPRRALLAARRRWGGLSEELAGCSCSACRDWEQQQARQLAQQQAGQQAGAG